MKEEDILSFSISDSEGLTTPVTVFPFENTLIVSCLSKDFYNAFGNYVIKVPAGLTNSFFQKKFENDFMKKFQEEFAKIQMQLKGNKN